MPQVVGTTVHLKGTLLYYFGSRMIMMELNHQLILCQQSTLFGSLFLWRVIKPKHFSKLLNTYWYISLHSSIWSYVQCMRFCFLTYAYIIYTTNQDIYIIKMFDKLVFHSMPFIKRQPTVILRLFCMKNMMGWLYLFLFLFCYSSKSCNGVFGFLRFP
jgi:hypothetical protein